MGNFKFTKTDIEGMFVVEPAVYGDNRGYFMETYNENDFKKAGYDLTFVQDNQSQSFKGVLRGLHLQLKYPQGKLVRVIKGEVFDVGVDLRADSPTYGKWHGEILSAENKKQLYILNLLMVLSYCLMKLNLYTNAQNFTMVKMKGESCGMTQI